MRPFFPLTLPSGRRMLEADTVLESDGCIHWSGTGDERIVLAPADADHLRAAVKRWEDGQEDGRYTERECMRALLETFSGPEQRTEVAKSLRDALRRARRGEL